MAPHPTSSGRSNPHRVTAFQSQTNLQPLRTPAVPSPSPSTTATQRCAISPRRRLPPQGPRLSPLTASGLNQSQPTPAPLAHPNARSEYPSQVTAASPSASTTPSGAHILEPLRLANRRAANYLRARLLHSGSPARSPPSPRANSLMQTITRDTPPPTNTRHGHPCELRTHLRPRLGTTSHLLYNCARASTTPLTPLPPHPRPLTPRAAFPCFHSPPTPNQPYRLLTPPNHRAFHGRTCPPSCAVCVGASPIPGGPLPPPSPIPDAALDPRAPAPSPLHRCLTRAPCHRVTPPFSRLLSRPFATDFMSLLLDAPRPAAPFPPTLAPSRDDHDTPSPPAAALTPTLIPTTPSVWPHLPMTRRSHSRRPPANQLRSPSPPAPGAP
jgi:hypothetical protein